MLRILTKPGVDIGRDLKGYDGIVVPGGFGQRGLEGKIKAAQYALKNKAAVSRACAWGCRWR